jgi:transcriptional regulator with XRE-family HTH domain
MNVTITLARQLRKVRKAKGHTLREAAEEMGTHTENVRRWELNAEPAAECYDRLMRYINVSFEELGVLILRGNIERADLRRKRDVTVVNEGRPMDSERIELLERKLDDICHTFL